jgi:hypothetical protein
VKLSLTREHGTRTVEVEDGREGVGAPLIARERVRALLSECRFCEDHYSPVAEQTAVLSGSLVPQLGLRS